MLTTTTEMAESSSSPRPESMDGELRSRQRSAPSSRPGSMNAAPRSRSRQPSASSSRAGSVHAAPRLRQPSMAHVRSISYVEGPQTSPRRISRNGSSGNVHAHRPSVVRRASSVDATFHRKPSMYGRAGSFGGSRLNLFPVNPFSSAAASIITGTSTTDDSVAPDDESATPGVYFRSRRIRKGETDRPELRERDSRDKWITIIPAIGIFVGFLSIGLMVWAGLKSVTNHTYCHVFTDDFSEGFNSTIWTKEVELGGYGNGEFEITTADDENCFIRDGMLVLKPTLQNASLVEANTLLNLTADGTCTASDASDCVFQGNMSTQQIIPPVKSARLTTKNFAVIKYGKIEVEAKLAAGDWLISSIWMLPAIDTYGAWPASGEIDIAMARGNNYTDSDGGNNIMQSTLRWGPNTDEDGWWRTNVGRTAPQSTYTERFHTFGLEWSEKYLYTYIDSRIVQVLYVGFNVPFWTRGYFPSADSNGTKLNNPWTGDGTTDATPFDQAFYLILSIAVGGTTGWFTDDVASKPWADASDTAKYDFWSAKDQWYPTWNTSGGGEMLVKSVKMYQQCD